MLTSEAPDSFALVIIYLAVYIILMNPLDLVESRLLVVMLVCACICIKTLHLLVIAQVYAVVCTLQ